MTRSRVKAFSLIETLIVLCVTCLILAATTFFLMGQNNAYKGQKERLSIEDQVRMAMDFTQRMMKGATESPAVAITGSACSNSVTFYYGEAFGVSTGSNSTTTLNDTAQNWTDNQWTGYRVAITGGGGSNQTRTIASNTTNQLVVSSDWTTVPDVTSVYKIVSEQTFSRSGTTLSYEQVSAGTGSEVLADHITCLTVEQDATYLRRYNITMTAETSSLMPDTHHTGRTTLQSSVEVRN